MAKSEFLTDVESCYLVGCQNNNILSCSLLRIQIGADGICMGYLPIDEDVYSGESNATNDCTEAFRHYCLANAYVKRGMIDAAVTEYQLAIGLNSAFGEAYCNLGNIYYSNLNDLDRAESCYLRAIECNNNDAIAHYCLANMYVNSARTDLAISHFEKTIISNPDNSEAHHNFGLCLLRTGNVEQGVYELREALRIDDNNANAHHTLGVALHKEFNDLPGAVAEHEKAISISPSEPNPYFTLADVYIDLELPKNAVECFEKYIFLTEDSNGQAEIRLRTIAKNSIDAIVRVQNYGSLK